MGDERFIPVQGIGPGSGDAPALAIGGGCSNITTNSALAIARGGDPTEP